MEVSDWAALLAMLISAGALALEVRRWFEGGPRIYVTVMANAKTVPADDGRPKFLIIVTNKGDVSTTITHMVMYSYRSQIHRIFGKPYESGFIPNPSIHAGLSGLPYELGINKQWAGGAYYDDELKESRRKGHLYVGVHATHSNGRFLAKVPATEPKVPAKKVGA
jgi:hypothetical protein